MIKAAGDPRTSASSAQQASLLGFELGVSQDTAVA
jgi:hypothetical protein